MFTQLGGGWQAGSIHRAEEGVASAYHLHAGAGALESSLLRFELLTLHAYLNNYLGRSVLTVLGLSL